MASNYRTSANRPALGFVLKRWHLMLAFAGTVFIAVAAIAGPYCGQAFAALVFCTLTLAILIPAAMLGLLITAPLAKGGRLTGSPWPDLLRLAIGAALGLGALSIGTLLLGSLGLLHHHIPLILPIAAPAAGVFHTHDFFKKFDRGTLRVPATRGDLLLLVSAVPIAVLLVAAMFPPGAVWATEAGAYDVREYHLQLPREYLANGSTAPLHHNAYSYFPANVEMLYLLQMSVTSLADDSQQHLLAIYPAQLLHAIFAILAGVIVALAPLSLPRPARLITLAAFLGTPWLLITGSLAYNDAGMILFGAVALALAFASPSRAAVIFIGFSLGLAIGCKLTAGTMFALPIAAILLMQRRLVPLLAVIAISIATYAPWAIRASADTKNPVFPIATSVFGAGHWTPEQGARWDAGHRAPENSSSASARLGVLVNESILDHQWSYLPTAKPIPGALWFALLLAIPLAIPRGPQAWLLLATLVIQLICWTALTHLQSRFLLPMAIPLAWLIGLGAPTLATPRFIIGGLAGAHALLAGLLLIPEHSNPQGDSRQLIGELRLSVPAPMAEVSTAPKFEALQNANLYLFGTATPYYYTGNITYHTVFDTDPLLAKLLDSPAEAKQFLLDKKIDYLIVSFSEIQRLADSYGFGKPALHDKTRAQEFTADIKARIKAMEFSPAPIQGEYGTTAYTIRTPE